MAPGKVFRFFLIRRCDCVGVGFPFLSSLIGSEKSRHSLNQSDAKLKQILIWSSAFSRASGSLLVFNLSSRWLLKVFSFLLFDDI